MIGIMGTVMFEVSGGEGPLGVRAFTFHDLKRQRAAKYAAHEVFGGKPLLEFTGLESGSFTLQIRLDAALGVDPAEKIDQIAGMLEAGQEIPLVLGGSPQGLYVIESVSEAWNVVESKGKIVSATLGVQLKEYPDG